MTPPRMDSVLVSLPRALSFPRFLILGDLVLGHRRLERDTVIFLLNCLPGVAPFLLVPSLLPCFVVVLQRAVCNFSTPQKQASGSRGSQTVWSFGPAAVVMDRCLAWIVTLLCLLLLVEAMAEASPYSVAGDDLDDYNDNLARLLFFTRKRSCIRRGGSCDHRPNDCCYNSSCRCNLWGTNCRCQRMGLFQKWGKK